MEVVPEEVREDVPETVPEETREAQEEVQAIAEPPKPGRGRPRKDPSAPPKPKKQAVAQ